MVTTVFMIDHNFSLIINPEAVKICPVLKKLTEEQILYIVLAYDYTFGPYRRKPLEERKAMAKERIWPNQPDDFIPEDFKLMKEAIAEYKSLIFDHNRESRDVLLQKKQLLEKELITESSAIRVKGIMDTINLIDDRLDNLVIKISTADKSMELKGGGELTWIELWQISRSEFKRANIIE